MYHKIRDIETGNVAAITDEEIARSIVHGLNTANDEPVAVYESSEEATEQELLRGIALLDYLNDKME